MDVYKLLGAYSVRVGKPFGRYLTVPGVVVVGSVLVPGHELTSDVAGLGCALSGIGFLSDPHRKIPDRYGYLERKFRGEEGLGGTSVGVVV